MADGRDVTVTTSDTAGRQQNVKVFRVPRQEDVKTVGTPDADS